MSGKFEKLNRARAAEGAARAQEILRLLAREDRTVHDLAERIGVSRCSIDNHLHGALHGQAHVDRWVFVRDRGTLAAVWTFGPGAHAEKPKPGQTHRIRAAKVDPDPEDWFDDRAKALAASTQPFRHPMDVALYGAAA